MGLDVGINDEGSTVAVGLADDGLGHDQWWVGLANGGLAWLMVTVIHLSLSLSLTLWVRQWGLDREA